MLVMDKHPYVQRFDTGETDVIAFLMQPMYLG